MHQKLQPWVVRLCVRHRCLGAIMGHLHNAWYLNNIHACMFAALSCCKSHKKHV